MFVIGGTLFCASFASSKEPPVARVLKLNYLAVILPEKVVRTAWDCEAWNPTVEQVTAAEKALIKYLREEKVLYLRDEKTINPSRPKDLFIVQYFGVVVERRKWIVCGVYNTRTLTELAKDQAAETLGYGFNDRLVSLLAYPYCETDSTDWFDVFFDSSTNSLSDSLGMTKDGNTGDVRQAHEQREITNSCVKEPRWPSRRMLERRDRKRDSRSSRSSGDTNRYWLNR